MSKTTLTIRNRFTGKTTTVAATKTEGMHIYSISAAQFDRIRSALGNGPIEADEGRIDAYKRSGQLHAVIDPSEKF